LARLSINPTTKWYCAQVTLVTQNYFQNTWLEMLCGHSMSGADGRVFHHVTLTTSNKQAITDSRQSGYLPVLENDSGIITIHQRKEDILQDVRHGLGLGQVPAGNYHKHCK
jgi:hypothetical protein